MPLRAAPGLKIGYVMGIGDQVPAGIGQLGYPVTLLDAAALATGDLARFDTIVTGTRAYAVREDLKTSGRRLLEYVKQGGNLVVLYNTDELVPSQFAPFPGVLDARAEEVSEEDSPVRILAPAAQVFRWPNRITLADFDGWVEQRGSKFWATWDPAYTPMLGNLRHRAAPSTGRVAPGVVWQGHLHLLRLRVSQAAAVWSARGVSAAGESSRPRQTAEPIKGCLARGTSHVHVSTLHVAPCTWSRVRYHQRATLPTQVAGARLLPDELGGTWARGERVDAELSRVFVRIVPFAAMAAIVVAGQGPPAGGRPLHRSRSRRRGVPPGHRGRPRLRRGAEECSPAPGRPTSRRWTPRPRIAVARSTARECVSCHGPQARGTQNGSNLGAFAGGAARSVTAAKSVRCSSAATRK